MSDPHEPLKDRLRRGDNQALAEFIAANERQLLAYIRSNLGDRLAGKVEPQDVLQETSVEALRSLPKVDLTEREPFSWLCQLAQRRIIDAHRKLVASRKRAADREVPLHARTPAGEGELIDLLVVTMTTPSQAFSRDERHARLEAAIASLPEENREALRLRYVAGLPSKTIAERMGKTDGAVRVLLSRSLKRLQALLGDPSRTP